MPEMGNELAKLGITAAGRGQFRSCRRSVVVAKVGMWLSFCTIPTSRGVSCIGLLILSVQKFDAHMLASSMNWCSRLLKMTSLDEHQTVR